MHVLGNVEVFQLSKSYKNKKSLKQILFRLLDIKLALQKANFFLKYFKILENYGNSATIPSQVLLENLACSVFDRQQWTTCLSKITAVPMVSKLLHSAHNIIYETIITACHSIYSKLLIIQHWIVWQFL